MQFLAVDNPPRVIVVTSSMPNEGKTTTAINIALALAEAEHNVVLVDGDMRRPMLDKYLDLVGRVGFSTVLSGRAALSDALQKTRFPRLNVLTAGAVPPNPSELLGSLAAQKVLGEMRANFDYVIVDSSPLLAVTDAAILATNSDGALIMARFGQTKREQLAHAAGNLQGVSAPILGAVFTMTPARGSASYSYSYYGRGRTPSHSSEADPDREVRTSAIAPDWRIASGRDAINRPGVTLRAPSPGSRKECTVVDGQLPRTMGCRSRTPAFTNRVGLQSASVSDDARRPDDSGTPDQLSCRARSLGRFLHPRCRWSFAHRTSAMASTSLSDCPDLPAAVAREIGRACARLVVAVAVASEHLP